MPRGTVYTMPGEPVLSPDGAHIASADFCARGCANELAIWDVQGRELRKTRVYAATAGWLDAAVRWKGKDMITVEVELAAGGPNEQGRRTSRTIDLSLADRAWKSDGR